MFSTIGGMFGMTSVEERDGVVYVYGIRTDHLIRDIEKIWKTSLITKYMFNTLGSSNLSFNSFFAPDFYYTLTQILEYKHRFTSRDKILRLMTLLLEKTWLQITTREYPHLIDLEQLKQFSDEPLPHQIEYVRHYDQTVQRMGLKGLLCAADAGTGKTLAELFLAKCLHADCNIIIAPKHTLQEAWGATIRRQGWTDVSLWISSEEKPFPRVMPKYAIFHYEALPRAIEFIRHFRPKKPVIGLDECHNFNDFDSLRTKLFIQLCLESMCQHIQWLSGTPVKALGYEVIPLLRTIDELFTPDTEARFKAIYGKNASRAVDILRNRLDLVSHKIPKSAVMTNAKPITQDIRVKLADGHRYTVDAVKNEMQEYCDQQLKHYQKHMDKYVQTYETCVALYEKGIISPEEREAFKKYQSYIKQIRRFYDARSMGDMSKWCNDFEKTYIIPALPSHLKAEFKKAKSIVKYVQLVVMGEALGQILGKRRAECHSALIEHSNLDQIAKNAAKKTVCFSNYVDTVLTATEYFKKHGFDPLVVYGETNKNVSEIVDRFKTDPSTNPLSATIQSLSTGVTLIVANVVAMLNKPFRIHEYEQAVNRIYRIGQDTQCYIYNLVLDTGDVPNISTRMEDILNWSKESVDAIMGTEAAAALNTKKLFAEFGDGARSIKSIMEIFQRFLGLSR